MTCKGRKMMFFTILLIGLGGFLIFSESRFANNTQTQSFRIIQSKESDFGKIEIRQYPPMILIQTDLNEKNKDSRKEAFKTLANYIFGGNDKKMKIPMTSPVIYKKANDENWTMNFIIPDKYKREDLPNQMNFALSKLSIVEEPEKKYISIAFSGMDNEKSRMENLNHLLSYTKTHSIQVNENPLILIYNPPWTLPFLRKNEILLEIFNAEEVANQDVGEKKAEVEYNEEE